MSTNNIHRQRESLTSSQRRLMNKELKKQMIRARECGWRSSTPMAAQRIPYYNAINDQYCSITDSKVFRSAQRKLRKRMKKGSQQCTFFITCAILMIKILKGVVDINSYGSKQSSKILK